MYSTIYAQPSPKSKGNKKTTPPRIQPGGNKRKPPKSKVRQLFKKVWWASTTTILLWCLVLYPFFICWWYLKYYTLMFSDPGNFWLFTLIAILGFFIEYRTICYGSSRAMFGYPPFEEGGDRTRKEYRDMKKEHKDAMAEKDRKVEKIYSSMTVEEKLKYANRKANLLHQLKEIGILSAKHSHWQDSNEDPRWASYNHWVTEGMPDPVAVKHYKGIPRDLIMATIRWRKDQQECSAWLDQIESDSAERKKIIQNNLVEWADLQERSKIRRQKTISEPQDDLNSPKIDKSTLRKNAWDLKIQDEKEFIEKYCDKK